MLCHLASFEQEGCNVEEHSAHQNTFPLSWSQRNIWNVEKSFSGTSINNICATIHIKGTLDIALLQKALNLVVQKDSSLRAELVKEGEEIRQYTHGRFD